MIKFVELCYDQCVNLQSPSARMVSRWSAKLVIELGVTAITFIYAMQMFQDVFAPTSLTQILVASEVLKWTQKKIKKLKKNSGLGTPLFFSPTIYIKTTSSLWDSFGKWAKEDDEWYWHNSALAEISASYFLVGFGNKEIL